MEKQNVEVIVEKREKEKAINLYQEYLKRVEEEKKEN